MAVGLTLAEAKVGGGEKFDICLLWQDGPGHVAEVGT